MDISIYRPPRGAKLALALFVLALLLFLSSCASERGPRRGAGPGAGPARGDPFARALTLKEAGDCAEAAALLRPRAAYGGGFEIAQYHLGDCLLSLAAAEPNLERRRLYALEGLTWLLKAAHSLNPDAQARLAHAYFGGQVIEADRIEAAKWLILYLGNGYRREVGAVALEPGLEQAIRDALTPGQWAEAEARAQGFERIFQPSSAPAVAAGPGGGGGGGFGGGRGRGRGEGRRGPSSLEG